MVNNMCDKEHDYFGDVISEAKKRDLVTKKHELVRMFDSPDNIKL